MLSDRVSLNLEVPEEKYAPQISPEKNFQIDLVATLKSLQQTKKQFLSGDLKFRRNEDWRRRRQGFRRRFGKLPSITTQFVVGVAGETDQELVKTTHNLQRNLGVYRVFYSALRPAEGTPLQESPPTPAWREHRLYQAEWLLREYHFDWTEIAFDKEGALIKEVDPKEAWARSNPDFFPIDIRTASYNQLLRVPGIGPITAKKIIKKRLLLCLRKPKPTFGKMLWGSLDSFRKKPQRKQSL